MNNIELLNEYYSQTGDNKSSNTYMEHDDMHADQIIDGVDGYPDSHHDRHYDTSWND